MMRCCGASYRRLHVIIHMWRGLCERQVAGLGVCCFFVLVVTAVLAVWEQVMSRARALLWLHAARLHPLFLLPCEEWWGI